MAECTAANIFCVRDRTRGHAAALLRMSRRSDAQRFARNRARRRHRGSRASLAPRGSVRGGRGFHHLDQPQPGWRGRDRGPHNSRRPRARSPCGWKRFFASTSTSTWRARRPRPLPSVSVAAQGLAGTETRIDRRETMRRFATFRLLVRLSGWSRPGRWPAAPVVRRSMLRSLRSSVTKPPEPSPRRAPPNSSSSKRSAAIRRAGTLCSIRKPSSKEN